MPSQALKNKRYLRTQFFPYWDTHAYMHKLYSTHTIRYKRTSEMFPLVVVFSSVSAVSSFSPFSALLSFSCLSLTLPFGYTNQTKKANTADMLIPTISKIADRTASASLSYTKQFPGSPHCSCNSCRSWHAESKRAPVISGPGIEPNVLTKNEITPRLKCRSSSATHLQNKTGIIIISLSLLHFLFMHVGYF